MCSKRTWRAAALSVVFVLTAFAGQATAQNTDRPLLSEEIRTVLKADGAAAAERRFNEIFPAENDEYQIDVKGLADLAQEYMMAGDYESGQAVAAMIARISQEMMTSSGMMPTVHSEATSAAREQRERENSEASNRAAPVHDYGPARDDLARFAGVYGDPDQPDSSRKLFVTESCDGYLVAGAMWGDASNWWMKWVSDNRFAMSSDFVSLRLEFQLGPDGNAQAMSHDLDSMPSPLVRTGPLPEGCGECLRRQGG